MIKRLLITLILLSALCPAGAVTPEAADSMIGALNHVLDRRDTYFIYRTYSIDSLGLALKRLDTSDHRRRAALLHQIYMQYSSYQSDSARAFADRELEAAILTGDKELVTIAQSDRLFSFISGGLFSDGIDVVRQTSLEGVSPATRALFYFRCIRLYSDMSNYADGTFRDRNASLSRAYSDSVMTLLPRQSYMATYASIFMTMSTMTLDQKISTFHDLLNRNDVDKGEKAMISSVLGDLYIEANDSLSAIYYKANSAKLDVESAKRETTAKASLARYMSERGNIELARRYIQLALEDAQFFNSKHRQSEINALNTVIASKRYDSLNSSKRNLEYLVAGLTVLVILLIFMLAVIVKLNKSLKASQALVRDRNTVIQDTNSQLTEANRKLEESMRIKEEYIGYGFKLNSQYIRKIEELYKFVDRKLAARQYDDLRAHLRKSDLRKEKENIQAQFDRIFKRLFPTFISEYRALFPPDDPGMADVPEGTLSSEMRIFALVRLGIHDSNDIATFLNYTPSTVNTYKSRAKKRSIVSSEDFERLIMEIKSVVD